MATPSGQVPTSFSVELRNDNNGDAEFDQSALINVNNGGFLEGHHGNTRFHGNHHHHHYHHSHHRHTRPTTLPRNFHHPHHHNNNNNNNNTAHFRWPTAEFVDVIDGGSSEVPRPAPAPAAQAVPGNPTPALPPAPPVACISLSHSLLPTCLALVFKEQTKIQLFQMPNRLPCLAPTPCPGKVNFNCPNCLQNAAWQNFIAKANAANSLLHHPHRNKSRLARTQSAVVNDAAVVMEKRQMAAGDLGYRLFRSFRQTNRNFLFWHKDLSRCLRRLEFVGYIRPLTVLVATTAAGDEWLDVLKRCWSQQLLVAPPDYSLEMLAEVQGCSMYSVCQSAAVNLIDAICGVISVDGAKQPTTLEAIFTAVTAKYAACGADIPPIAIFHDMLSFLVAKRRVVLTPAGNYRMASKENYAHAHRRQNYVNDKNIKRNHHVLVDDADKNGIGNNNNSNSNSKAPASLLRKLLPRRFFGRAKSRDSTPPPRPNPAHAFRSTRSPSLRVTSSTTDGPSHINNDGLATSSPHVKQPAVGLFDCYNTGAVPSLSCSTIPTVSDPNRLWSSAAIITTDKINNHHHLNSRNGRQHRQVSSPSHGYHGNTPPTQFVESNYSIDNANRLTAPFSTPTSVYLSSADISKNNNSSNNIKAAGDIKVDDTAASSPVDDVMMAMMMMSRQSLSTPSSSSWSSSGAGAVEDAGVMADSSIKAPVVSSVDIDIGPSSGEESFADDDGNIKATCAKIVTAELDSLIERYRRSSNATTANDDVASTSNNNKTDCLSCASSGTLFSVGDYMVYSASLTVERQEEDGEGAGNNKLISAPTIVVSGVDSSVAAEKNDSDVKADKEIGEGCDGQGAVTGPTMIAIDDPDEPNYDVLKLDAGQAIFGA